jgi:hypothetical protein
MNKPSELHRRDFITKSTLATAALAGANLLPSEGFAADVPRINREKIRVGHIGCGSVSGAYLPVMTKHPHIEVVSVCDIVPERARKRAEQFKVPNVYPNIDAMLAPISHRFDSSTHRLANPALVLHGFWRIGGVRTGCGGTDSVWVGVRSPT